MSDIKEYIYAHKQEMIDILAELVAVPSVQGKAEEGAPFGKESARALDIMLKKCENFGFYVENTDNYVGSADINGLAPGLAVITHLDVVPVGTGWTTDPFKLRYETETGKLVGRGTIDDKGPAVAALFAAKAVKELGFPLKKGIRLIFGTNEENGSEDLVYYRKKHELPKMVFTPDGEYPLINAEKGMLRVYFSTEWSMPIEIKAGTVINAVPSSCEITSISDSKMGPCVEFNADGKITYTDEVRRRTETISGVSAHASTPEKGENAITKFLAANMIICPPMNELKKLFPHGEFNGKSCELGFKDNISGDMTCVLSLLNTENKRIYGGIDIRFPLDRTKSEISDIICKKLRVAGFEVDSCEGVEPHYTDENSGFVQTLLSVYERVTGDKGRCIAIGGGTYVHEIEGGVAFGAEFPNKNNNMHCPDEFISVDDLIKNAEIMAEAMKELCG